MNFLGHISVCESYGIRRFLYPVSLEIPSSLLDPASGPGLTMPDGRQIPFQVSPGASDPDLYRRLDFAVSLSPFEKLELKLFTDLPGTADMDDPIRVEEEDLGPAAAPVCGTPARERSRQASRVAVPSTRFKCSQRRFSVEFDRTGTLHEVVYDSAHHLRAPAVFVRNGRQAALEGTSAFAVGFPLTARVTSAGEYPDGCGAATHLETTAYKSWVMLTHFLSRPLPEDEVVFHLPLAVSSSVVTCDFGAGGGIYGALHAETCPEIVWQSEFQKSGAVRWSISSGGRTDYVGEAQTVEEYLRQQWFHWIDGRRALAVAVTQVPVCCREIKITLRAGGDVAVAFRIGDPAGASAAFGLCCHFLNDIPAIAAATNPQSILLPPVVTKGF